MLRPAFKSRGSCPATVLLVAALGCSEQQNPTAPAELEPAGGVVSVKVTPDEPLLTYLGQTMRLSATAYDVEGHEITDARFSWRSSTPAVVKVDQDGDVAAVSNGSARIEAAAGSVLGVATVLVRQEVAELVFITEVDCGIPAGTTIAPAVEIALLDEAGHRMADASDVTIGIESSSRAKLSGTTSVRAAGGTAVFSDLSIDRPGSYTFVASAEGRVSAAGERFEIEKGPRAFCIIDPLGDHTGTIDVVRMVMNFDDATGDYEIVLTVDSANPFRGDFRININLFNPDVGTTARYPSFFSDAMNDYELQAVAQTLTLMGSDGRLTAWDLGDRVFTNSLAGTGNPDGVTLFRSSVADLPHLGFLTAEDYIAFAEVDRPAIVR
jgi:hypothetical protein